MGKQSYKRKSKKKIKKTLVDYKNIRGDAAFSTGSKSKFCFTSGLEPFSDFSTFH